MRWLLVLVAFFSMTLSAADLSGNWKATYSTPNGKSVGTLVLKSDGDKLTGTTKGPMGEFPIQDGNSEGLDVYFHVIVNRDGTDMKMTYRGRLFTNDEIQFRIEFGEQSFDMIAKRL